MNTKKPLPIFLPLTLLASIILLAAGLGFANRAAREHPISASPDERTAADVLDAARVLFSKSMYECADLPETYGQAPVESVGELWLDYICERGPAVRAFSASSALTRELAISDAIHSIRRDFYEDGGAALEGVYEFNLGEFVSATGDMITKAKETQQGEFSISHFLGSFTYRVTREGDRVRFVVHNRTDRSSGTRIPLRFPQAGYSGTLEGLLSNEPALAGQPFLDLLLDDRRALVSVLAPKTREETDDQQDEGGGAFEQTFEWTERWLPVGAKLPLITYQNLLDLR